MKEINKSQIEHVLNKDNEKYVSISLEKPWGLCNYIADSNGLRYFHHGIRSIEEPIHFTKNAKNRKFNIDPELIEFLKPFSTKEITNEVYNLSLENIVKGKKKVNRAFGEFILGVYGGLLIIPSIGYSIDYPLLGVLGGLAVLGGSMYDAKRLTSMNNDYNKFCSLIDVSEDADYFIKHNENLLNYLKIEEK